MRKFRLYFILPLIIITLLSGCVEKEKDFSFVFMTDIHVQWKRQANEGLTAAVNKINTLQPDFVISGGDLIMDALNVKLSRADSLYNLYLNIVSNFKMPLYNTLGNHEVFGLNIKSGITEDNHDYGKKLFLRKMNYKQTYRSINHKGWHFIILDGIGFTDDRNYYGYIDSLQIEWLKKDLQGLSKSTPIVISTHIPFVSIFSQMRNGPMAAFGPGEVVTNSKQVLDMFDEYNLKLVLQGHLHEVEDIMYKGTHFITGGAVCASWWKGAREGHPEGFVVVDVKGDDFTWHYQTYGWDAEQGKVVTEADK